jgi:hypothetical protein
VTDIVGNRDARAREWQIWLPLCLMLAFATGFTDLYVRGFRDLPVTKIMPAIMNGTEAPPGRYRILVPYMHDIVTEITHGDRMIVFLALRLIGWFASYAIFYAYLRTWFPIASAIAGTALVAAAVPLTFTNSWAHPDHVAELALFTLGCLTIARGLDAAFAVTLAFATLNRETAVFLVMLYFLAGPLTRTRAIKTIGFGAIWFAIFAGLRLWLGFENYEYWQLGKNIEFMKLLGPGYDPYKRAFAYFVFVLFGPLLYVALRAQSALKDQPIFIRRALWVVPAMVLVGVTISSIIETRIFTPLFPLIIPATVAAFSNGVRAQGD